MGALSNLVALADIQQLPCSFARPAKQPPRSPHAPTCSPRPRISSWGICIACSSRPASAYMSCGLLVEQVGGVWVCVACVRIGGTGKGVWGVWVGKANPPAPQYWHW